MLALSIKQPWTMLIMDYNKDAENRTWKVSYRGPVLFHNSGKFDGEYRKKLHHDLYKKVSQIMNQKVIGSKGLYKWNLGHVVGAGILTDVVDISYSDWCMPGCYYWKFKNIIKFKTPIICKGKLRLFKPDIKKEDFQAIDYKNYTNLSNISEEMGFDRII